MDGGIDEEKNINRDTDNDEKLRSEDEGDGDDDDLKTFFRNCHHHWQGAISQIR